MGTVFRSLADILTHWADVAQWMMDDAKPRAATAAGGIYFSKNLRENPDTVNALIAYDTWNLTFESSVLPVRTQKPSVLFQGTEGSLDLSRDGYTFKPYDGVAERVDASGDLDVAHVSSFLDAVTDGKAPSAPIAIGLEALRPVHLAVAAYWNNKRTRLNTNMTAIEVI